MAEEHSNTAAFRGAVFRTSDLNGATFRECDLSGVRIAGSLVAGLRVSGFSGDAGLLVDDIDVTEYVRAELDRRFPERVQLRAMRTADDHRAMWETVERTWAETRARAERLPEAARHERVDGEWSVTETLRHLAFATDTWIGHMLLGQPAAYHRLGLPPTDLSPEGAAALGLDVDAEVSYADAVALHDTRRAQVRDVLAGLTDDALTETRSAVLAAEWGEESRSVAECLRVLMSEHCDHRRFTERDLAALEARA